MRTLALPLFLFIGLVGFTFAQTDKLITKWIQLDRPDDEFSLETPEGFEFERSRDSDDKISARGEFHSDSERFYIFIDSPKEREQRKKVEAFLQSSNQDTSEMTIDEAVAARAGFEDSTGYYHRVIFIRTDSRLFTLQTVSTSKNSEVAKRFLNSFQLRPKSLPNSVQSNRDAFKTPETTEEAQGGGISGGDTGTGRTAGVGSGSAAPRPIDNSPLKVTFKLKAQYTEFARFYMIQGTVSLRVTFLATGQIGSITTIKKLPFGLTETATNAATQMRFEPEMVNGVARTTSLPVSFTFNIY
jgi:TonB family protein